MTSAAQPVARRADVVRGVSWVGLSHVIGQIAWYASLFIIAAIVTPKQFGSVTFAMVLVQVSWLVVGSGTRGSFISTPGRIGLGQIRYATAINVGMGLAMGCVVAAAAHPLVELLAPGSNVAVLQVLAISITFFGISIVPMALLQKELLFKRHAGVTAFSAAASSVLAIIAGELGLGVWALVLRQVLYQMLMAILAWPAARPVLPSRDEPTPDAAPRRRAPQAKWFFLVSVIAFASLNIDYVIVGRFTTVAQLGLYSLAFTIAFAPVTQFAWQIGKVLFPAAARTEGLESIAERTLKAVRLTALVLIPLIPPAVMLAPAVLPHLLGHKWAPVIGPLQILLAVGIIHAVFAIIREFLFGTGHVRLCARIDAGWLLGTAAAMFALVPLDGIEGAAIAHLLMLFPLAAAYTFVGLPRLGLNSRRLARALAGVVGAVAVETAVIALGAAAVSPLQLPSVVVAVVVPAIGILAALVILWRGGSAALADARSMFAAVRGQPAPST
jgi:O-antigen/teichoic acid export membrane protein